MTFKKQVFGFLDVNRILVGCIDSVGYIGSFVIILRCHPTQTECFSVYLERGMRW